jgi:hypothetical protein
MTMLTYHGDHDLKAAVLAELAAHRVADEIIQGTYWRDGKGCAVGCLTHDPHGGHHLYESRWGIPEWLARLEDAVFEGLPLDAAKGWPERFMGAVPVGVEITDSVADGLAVERLTVEVLPLAPSWPEPVRAEVVGAVEQVIDALGGDDLAARARSAGAAWAAESAAWAAAWAARAAAESAAWAAESAAWAARWAESAGWAAESAARWEAEADRIIAALAMLGETAIA